MNRETKYKAWDKKNEAWDDVNNIYIDQDGEVYLIEERTWAYQSFMHKENVSESYDIVFYTGLKDRNDKEIYEGDIIKIPDLYETPENTSTTYHNAVVTFEESAFCLSGSPLYEDHQYISDECEIIGDIYTNPELLEG